MNKKITLLLIIALLAVSTSPIIGRALDNVSSVSISFWRMFIAGSALWIFSFLRPQGKMKLTYNIKKTIYAGILLGIHFILFFEAIKITKISNATFLGTLAPFFTLIVEYFFLKRFYDKKVLLGLFFTIIGSLVIIGHQFDLSSEYTLGNLYAILCSISIAASLMIGESIRKNEDTIVYTRTLYMSAALTLFFIAIISEEQLIGYNNNEYLGLIFLGLVPTILGHNAIYYSLRYVSPTIVAAFPLGEPIIATILAYFIFFESITLNIFIGGSITFVGLILISLYKKIK
jgi:drug/metabolite transporter (DMT)-like permease